MTNYIGEFDCKVDAKGRMMVPAGLLKQFAPAIREKFVINRNVFQKCLVLYPMDAWDEIVKDLSRLNKFIKENDDFIRQYNNGATQVEIDNTNRLLLPKRLLDYAGIDKDVVLTAQLNKIEIWSAEKYNAIINSFDPEKFGALAERVMGKSNPSSTSHDLP
jgi:MraZ protein